MAKPNHIRQRGVRYQGYVKSSPPPYTSSPTAGAGRYSRYPHSLSYSGPPRPMSSAPARHPFTPIFQ